MQELNLQGVFVPAAFVWAVTAFLLTSALGRWLDGIGFYRLVWHRALFAFATFVIVWAALSAISYHLAFANAGLR
jgi:Protein of unknown function (DUF1656)